MYALCVGDEVDALVLPLRANSQYSTVASLLWLPPVRPLSLSWKTQLEISRPVVPE